MRHHGRNDQAPLGQIDHAHAVISSAEAYLTGDESRAGRSGAAALTDAHHTEHTRALAALINEISGHVATAPADTPALLMDGPDRAAILPILDTCARAINGTGKPLLTTTGAWYMRVHIATLTLLLAYRRWCERAHADTSQTRPGAQPWPGRAEKSDTGTVDEAVRSVIIGTRMRLYAQNPSA